MMMMMNYAMKTRPRRAFGKRPPAPRKPKGKPGRPFVGAHGGGTGINEYHKHPGNVMSHGATPPAFFPRGFPRTMRPGQSAFFLRAQRGAGLPRRGQLSGPWLFSTAEARMSNSSSSSFRGTNPGCGRGRRERGGGAQKKTYQHHHHHHHHRPSRGRGGFSSIPAVVRK